MDSALRLRLLRLLLLFSAVAWGISFYGVFAPWPDAVVALQGLGAKTIPDDPMLNYWLRMAAGAFGFVGCLYLRLAVYPQRHADIIPWFGWLMVAEGMVLLVHGVQLHLSPFPWIADTAACLVGGGGIVWLAYGLQLNPAEVVPISTAPVRFAKL